MRWQWLDDATQDDVFRMGLAGQVHPDEAIAMATWEYIREAAPRPIWVRGLVAVILAAVDLMLGGSGTWAGNPDGRTIRQRWRDDRSLRRLYRTYRKSDIPARYRAAKIPVEDLLNPDR